MSPRTGVPDISERDLLSEAQEDYLKQVLLLGGDERAVATQALADRLGVRPASVTGMIRRLAELGFLEHQPYRGVRLKETGKKVALAQIRRHRLLETWLERFLGYDWDEVHPEAERLEHAISELFVRRIDALLDYPTHDPHGEPIPTADLRWPEGDTFRSLVEMHAGEKGAVARVRTQDRDTLGLLARLGLRLGAKLVVENVGDQGVAVRVGGDRFLVPRETAALLMMEVGT